MARQHYTERDILDLHSGDCHVLEISPDVERYAPAFAPDIMKPESLPAVR